MNVRFIVTLKGAEGFAHLGKYLLDNIWTANAIIPPPLLLLAEMSKKQNLPGTSVFSDDFLAFVIRLMLVH